MQLKKNNLFKWTTKISYESSTSFRVKRNGKEIPQRISVNEHLYLSIMWITFNSTPLLNPFWEDSLAKPPFCADLDFYKIAKDLIPQVSLIDFSLTNHHF